MLCLLKNAKELSVEVKYIARSLREFDVGLLLLSEIAEFSVYYAEFNSPANVW